MLVPIIAVLGNVAISKAFGGSGIDTTKELTALSVANVCGSFVSSFPVTGSFSRSAVNHASGVKTPIGGVYTSNPNVCFNFVAPVFTNYFKIQFIIRYSGHIGIEHIDTILFVHSKGSIECGHHIGRYIYD